VSWTRREILRLAAAAPLVGACDQIGREIHIGSRFRPTPEAPLTPMDDFYVVSNFGQPDRVRGASEWRLEVGGLVGRGGTLARGDLDRFATVTAEVTLECIGNDPGGDLISSTRFTGVRLADLLAAAAPSTHARGVHLEGEDGYFAFLPLEAALDPRPLLVTAMGDAPLTAEHGAPVRALFPGRHGMFSVKWLRAVTLTRQWGAYGALTSLSNIVEGITPVISRLDDPGELFAGVETTLGGIALTAGPGVARVEVRGDGDWIPAEIVFNALDDERSPHLWSLWRARFTPARPGALTLAVRAFDRDGRTQSFEPRFPYDSGAVHAVHVVVR
jgi:DMSO/TMAO reductase YedYZ molybdopterin-dependent catalytic subunit